MSKEKDNTKIMVLDRCFSDQRHKYSIDDLLDKVNEFRYDVSGPDSTIKERTLRKYISRIRNMLPSNVYLESRPYDGKKCYYRYSDPDFSIYNNEMSIDEIDTLRAAIEMLQPFRNSKANAWLEEVISKLEYRFGLKANTENVVNFGQNDDFAGLKNLSAIIDHTTNHQPLNIYYQPYGKEEELYLMHPYYIKEYNNRWFLFGFVPDKSWIMNMALDRIVSFSVANVPFIPNKDIDFSTYFDDVVGVTVPKNVVAQEIVLRFYGNRLNYVLSKPIHKSQKQVEGKEDEIVIRVKPNKELCQQIFSFLPDVEVVSPEWFRKEISKKIAENLKKYFPMHDRCTDDVELCNVNNKE